DINIKNLTAFAAMVTGMEYDEIAGYIHEINEDNDLRNHIESITQNSKERYKSDKTARYGRRIGWYAVVRAIKPGIVVETGVDKGLGSCIICAALKKNSEDGKRGYYYGTDINPEAGFLYQNEYKRFGEILYGDSIESLKKLDKTIDLFINDSDHSAEYEEQEYKVIKDKLNKEAVLLADNAHCSDKLLNFSGLVNKKYLFFQES
ncbi:MAG: class I SAM-dependent methyltransferase, partial [bacterium]|nr:class I SAM-dependent methyltransferase [bacterium]